MLDERQYKAIESKSKGANISDMARDAGVSRNTIYKWIELEEFKAELGKCQQEFVSSTIHKVTSYAPKNIEGLIELAERADSEKVRLDARLALLNKVMPNTTKVSIDDSRDNRAVISIDVLDAELEEFDNE